MSGSVSVRTVTQTAITIADHVGADDSESKSTDGAEKWNSEGKLRTFLRVFEKLNMVFIVLFICYLSWTIPAHYGLYTSESNSQKFTGNQTLLLQVRMQAQSSAYRYGPLTAYQRNAVEYVQQFPLNAISDVSVYTHCWHESSSTVMPFVCDSESCGIPSGYQIVWTQNRPDEMSGLIWVLAVCKSYQQKEKVPSASKELDEPNSTDNQIPFYDSSDHNFTDTIAYHTDIILPMHRKQSKRRRKKQRNRKRHRNRKGNKFYANIEDYLNLTNSKSNQKTRNSKDNCKDCKIRKRKGRNRNSKNRMNTTVLRKILERVADDTLSGARSGEGTISSLLENNIKSTSEYSEHDRKDGSDTEKSWGSSQNWLNLATQTGYSIDGNVIQTDEFSKWSSWSSCSTSCGAGQQERTRRCGTACKEVESMMCISPSCEGVDETDNSKTINEFYQWENEGFIPPMTKPQEEFLNHETDACDQWLKCNRDVAQKFIKKSFLPGCPCSFPLKRVKSKSIWDPILEKDILWSDVSTHNVLAYKPGATYCMRSQLAPGTVTLAVQQCCFDVNYSLITRGKAAGTPNQVSPYISKELHYKVDLLPWVICKGDWTRYNMVLPPNNALKCRESPSAKELQRQRIEVKNY